MPETMPKCMVLIHGQERKYCGVHMYIQEEMPAKLNFMDQAEYAELRRVVNQRLEPANRAVARVGSWRVMRFVNRVPFIIYPLLFVGLVLPCLAEGFLPTWLKIVVSVGLCLLFGVLLALRLCSMEYIDRQAESAFRDIAQGCRKFSRGKHFKVDMRRREVGGSQWGFQLQRTEYALRIMQVLKADFVGSLPQAGTRLPVEAVPEEDASVGVPTEGAGAAELALTIEDEPHEAQVEAMDGSV